MHDEAQQRLERIWEGVAHLPAFRRLTPRGVAYARAALFNGPSREVGKGALFNNTGAIRTASGLEVDFESESGEATFILLCESEGTPLLLPQPPQITVLAYDARGRRQHRRQRPDYLKIAANAVHLVEVKPLAKLESIRARAPADWSVNDGQWSYLPGKNAAQLMGMDHQVFCTEQYSPQYRANLRYIVAARRRSKAELPVRLNRCLHVALSERPRTIRELLEASTELDADHVLDLIERGELFGLLHHQTIGPDFLVFGNESQRDRARAEIESYRIHEIRPGSYAHRLVRATQVERDHAVACSLRYKERRSNGDPMNSTDHRHRNAMNAAIAEGAPAIAALIPRFSDRGGQGSPLPGEQIAMLRAFLKEYLVELKKKPSASEAHAELVRRNGGSSVGLPVVETVRKYLAMEFTPERAAALYGGARAIQKARRKTEGAHCIERVDVGGMWSHCDAVYADVVPDDDEDWKITRPVVFPLVMANSLYIASAGIMFGKPSSLGFLMALRACVHDHGWLPKSICADGGPEFSGDAWKVVAASLDVNRVKRPVACSRAGAEVESVNGALNAYLQTIAGGTYHDQAGRDSDGKRKGRQTAQHDMQRVVREILGWIDDWNGTRHGDSFRTPREAFEDELMAFPSSVVPISMDENTRYLTSYPIKAKGFTYERGVAFAGRRYACDQASRLIHQGEAPGGLRLDVFDPSTLWTISSLGLLRLTSNDHHRIAGMCRVERILAVAERMRYHIVSKRNQANYRLILAKRRSDLKATDAAERCAEAVPPHSQIASKAVPRASSKPSFADLAQLPRSGLRIVGGDVDDTA